MRKGLNSVLLLIFSVAFLAACGGTTGTEVNTRDLPSGAQTTDRGRRQRHRVGRGSRRQIPGIYLRPGRVTADIPRFSDGGPGDAPDFRWKVQFPRHLRAGRQIACPRTWQQGHIPHGGARFREQRAARFDENDFGRVAELRPQWEHDTLCNYRRRRRNPCRRIHRWPGTTGAGDHAGRRQGTGVVTVQAALTGKSGWWLGIKHHHTICRIGYYYCYTSPIIAQTK